MQCITSTVVHASGNTTMSSCAYAQDIVVQTSIDFISSAYESLTLSFHFFTTLIMLLMIIGEMIFILLYSLATC
jgi:hypothetical protein